jgi:formylmethanofuran dehydrogenase subunit D
LRPALQRLDVLATLEIIENETTALSTHVRSARGEIVGTAHLDMTIRPGVVSVPHGHEHANVNYLTDTQEVDPLTGMARYSGIQVSVHPIPSAPMASGSPGV